MANIQVRSLSDGLRVFGQSGYSSFWVVSCGRCCRHCLIFDMNAGDHAS